MPMHDWTRVDPNDYHTFHLSWLVHLVGVLNKGRLPAGYYAILDHRVLLPARRRIVINQVNDKQIVSVIEIVSPSDKAKLRDLALLADDLVCLLKHGIHLLVIDPFAANCVHSKVMEQLWGKPFESGQSNGGMLVSYAVEDTGPVACVEPGGIGSVLPDWPLFLRKDVYISLPLEETYMTAWNGYPKPLRQVIEQGH